MTPKLINEREASLEFDADVPVVRLISPLVTSAR